MRRNRRDKKYIPAYDVRIPGIDHPMLHIPQGTALFDSYWRDLIQALKRIYAGEEYPDDVELVDRNTNRIIDAYLKPERKGMPEHHYQRREKRLTWYVEQLRSPSSPAYKYLESSTKNRLLIDVVFSGSEVSDDDYDPYEGERLDREAEELEQLELDRELEFLRALSRPDSSKPRLR